MDREDFKQHMDSVRDRLDHVFAETFAEFFLCLNEKETARFIAECLDESKDSRRGRLITFFTDKYWLAYPNPTHTVRRRPSAADDE